MNHSLQTVKEQLKIKSSELKKQEREASRLHRKVSQVTQLNKDKIRELHLLLKQKDKEIQEAKQMASVARISRHITVKQSSSQENKETRKPDFGVNVPDLKNEWKQKLDELTIKEKAIRKRLVKEQKALDKSNREKSYLLRELRRFREKINSIDDLNQQIIRLKTELKKRPTLTNEDLQERLKEKEKLIEHYEKFYKESAQSMEKGLLSSEYGYDLKNQLSELIDENNELNEKLEQQQEYISDIERKAIEEQEKKDIDRFENNIQIDSRAKGSTEFSSGLESFLVTYSDMITLILVIFVLLFTISKVDQNRFAEAFSSFQEKEFRWDDDNIHLSQQEVTMLNRVKELVQDNVDPESLIRSDVKTLSVRLQSNNLFSPGDSDLLPKARDFLKQALNDYLKEGVKQIYVEGHTDDVPIHNEKFPSNWELSTARASRVARFITESLNFPPNRIVVKGFGKYRPQKPNSNDKNRALNRRVEIKILKDKDVLDDEIATKKISLNQPGKNFKVLLNP